MHYPQSVVRGLGLALLAAMLNGCSLEAAMTSCADCGEVRSITPRVVRSDIRLYTNAPETYAASDAGAAETPLVFHVRVRMDRGGSRDFVLPRAAELHVGDRVEIRSGALVVRSSVGHRWS